LSCLLHVAGLVRAQRALNLPDSAGGFLGLIGRRILPKNCRHGPARSIVFGGCYLISLILPHQFPSELLGGVDRGSAMDFWHRKRSGKSKSR
jgi:hypothetical protein